MKRVVWTILMLAASTAMVVSQPKFGHAGESCQEKECTRNLQCLVECPACNGSPGNPGTCWWNIEE